MICRSPACALTVAPKALQTASHRQWSRQGPERQLYVRAAVTTGVSAISADSAAGREDGCLGALLVGLNPIHAPIRSQPGERCPYSPSSRIAGSTWPTSMCRPNSHNARLKAEVANPASSST